MIAGLAAAVYLYPALATVTETRELLGAYAAAPDSPQGPAKCSAAGPQGSGEGLTQSNSARDRPVTCLTRDEADERLRQAGMGWNRTGAARPSGAAVG